MTGIKALFPTRVLMDQLARDASAPDLNAELLDDCLMVADGDEAGQAWSEENAYFGYTSYASLNDLPARTTAFGKLAALIETRANLFADEIGYDLHATALTLDSFWINVLEPGGHHSGHIHPNSVISGTYYLKVDEGASRLKFEDPRLPMLMNAPARKKSLPEADQRFVYITPEAGMVLMWESWLRHEVTPNLSDDIRVSISFNLSET